MKQSGEVRCPKHIGCTVPAGKEPNECSHKNYHKPEVYVKGKKNKETGIRDNDIACNDKARFCCYIDKETVCM